MHSDAALPAALHKHVRTIAPTTAFTSTRLLQPEEMPHSPSGGAVNATSGEPVKMLLRRQPNPGNSGIVVNPSILRALYRTLAYSPTATDNNVLGIVGYDNEYPSRVDLSTFMALFRTDAAAAIPTIEVINYRLDTGSKLTQGANLDIQYALALAYPTPVIYYGGIGNHMEIIPGTNLPGPGDIRHKKSTKIISP
jgi:tripeptidyl-peptidase-1